MLFQSQISQTRDVIVVNFYLKATKDNRSWNDTKTHISLFRILCLEHDILVCMLT